MDAVIRDLVHLARLQGDPPGPQRLAHSGGVWSWRRWLRLRQQKVRSDWQVVLRRSALGGVADFGDIACRRVDRLRWFKGSLFFGGRGRIKRLPPIGRARRPV